MSSIKNELNETLLVPDSDFSSIGLKNKNTESKSTRKNQRSSAKVAGICFGILILVLTSLGVFYNYPCHYRSSPKENIKIGTDTKAAIPKIYKGPKNSIFNNSPGTNNNTVILLSIDGFKHGYFNYGLTPNIVNLGKTGIFPEYMLPSFPTITFPNHYTIATGLYPESHGIVGNTFYDSSLNDTFSYTSPESTDSKWWGGEPIWVTAAKNYLKTAIYMFPGSEAEIKGHRPTYSFPYKSDVSQTTKIDKLIEWLTLPPALRPTFLAAYFPEVDSAGHNFGPYSKEVNDSLVQIDNSIGYLTKRLAEINVSTNVNLVIVSDHGMSLSKVPRDSISLNSLLSKASLSHFDKDDFEKISLSSNSKHPIDTTNMIRAVHLWPHAGIYLYKDSDLQNVYQKLKSIENTSMFEVFLKKDIPDRFVFKNSLRIPPIVIIAKRPYFISYYAKKASSDLMNRQLYKSIKSFMNNKKEQTTNSLPDINIPNTAKEQKNFGVHGYDNMDVDMRAIFIGNGPAFKSSNKSPLFDNTANSNQIHNYPYIKNVDVYNILTSLLNIQPAPNNGTAAIASDMLV
ncbi:putative pyrophosphatase/phosphodiesterase [Smittium culicis]|uniref:Putative pyrophosphatase/phosphodiesterase n=1 Tax=Smittium culicis TaxID=133412 RepID=A0A1R1XF57_9FUNG|nr:putative pyrophosphatase/phosphodiesterase [Smittium culicis]OMJ13248.1 putative pyrophosphatase/phosphodiesterase [Smittium culicis]OMJ21833.1 putative pyrophosphatase/phosphodiesterase [Smittium culicis]